jgi:hypothetical protein
VDDLLAEVLRALTAFDSADLVASFAALQLLPENSDHVLRLIALAHVAASLEQRLGKRQISAYRLQRICEEMARQEESVAALEDPCETFFSEDFPFFGGSYVIFPGVLEDAPFIYRQLSAALFLLEEPFPDKEVVTNAAQLLRAALVLSDEVARRASIRHGVEPVEQRRERVTIPNGRALTRLKGAVTFTQAELESLLAHHKLPLTAVAALTIELGEVSPVVLSGAQQDKVQQDTASVAAITATACS